MITKNLTEVAMKSYMLLSILNGHRGRVTVTLITAGLALLSVLHGLGALGLHGAFPHNPGLPVGFPHNPALPVAFPHNPDDPNGPFS